MNISRPSAGALANQLSEGVWDVFVNGVAVLDGGKHTGAKPGRIVRGPGWLGRR